ncbi:MAG: PLP-dependent aminotransferase family protein [Firmicutes bacterium]|nr:PLP-dependent aminotransferase family protein [Bacillota bacterium]
MKPIMLDNQNNSKRSLYIQIYENLKQQILHREAASGEKLPSLRVLSKTLGVSVTTIELAYNQLLVEGYIISKPQSGYYVSQMTSVSEQAPKAKTTILHHINDYTVEANPYLYDLSCFDFNKWKKCAAKVYNDYASLLLFESDPQGEAALRFEISKYLYTSRGVTASPEQIVIGAGTQQITSHLSRILLKMGIHHVSLESPGYLPVQSMFADAGFTLSHILVGAEGIHISRLPVNIPSVVYVSPSNQFPTGAVMPIARRYELLDWAKKNQSIIIEDDYDSELRYFGRPVPALQGLDDSDRVVYLGSFSSTLFPAIKISYMVLPPQMSEIFNTIKDQYTQTCSKAEQLTLAIYMEDGYYSTGIKKLRNLYAQKLQVVLQAFHHYGQGLVTPIDTRSGINLTLKVYSEKSAELLSDEARSLQLEMLPLAPMTEGAEKTEAPVAVQPLIFYYNQAPLDQLEDRIKDLLALWSS